MNQNDITVLLRIIRTFEQCTFIKVKFEIEVPMKLETFIREYTDYQITAQKPDRWFDYEIIEKENSFIIRNN